MLPEKELNKIAKEFLAELREKNPIINKMCTNTQPQGAQNRVQPNTALFLNSGEQKILQKIKTAMEHYLEGDPRLEKTPAELKSHCNGIDFTMPVSIITIPANTELTQMQASGKGTGETRQGNYYAFKTQDSYTSDELQEAADIRGIADSSIKEGELMEGTDHKLYISPKAMTTFKTTQEIKALHTTAAKIDDTWSIANWVNNQKHTIPISTPGGGQQIHINQKENLTIQPELKEQWERYIDLIKINQLPSKEFEKAEEVLQTYAMVLYNRASFNKDLIQPAIDAFIYLEDNFKSLKNKNICQNALETTKAAIEHAIRKHENLGTAPANDDKVANTINKLIAERKQELSSSKPENSAPKNKIK